MFSDLLKDKVKLIKKDGREIDNIYASVQNSEIFTEYTKIAIDEGDTFLRKLPNGKEEYYEVINPVFHGSLLGLPANYQIEVRKKTLAPKQPPIYVQANGHAKVNINSVDNSINKSFNNSSEIFDKLLNIAKQIDGNTEIIKSITEMKKSFGNKETFKEKYNNFI